MSTLSTTASQLCRFDAQSKTELLLLIQLYLQSEPKYRDNARALFDAIERNESVPMRYDVNGVAHQQSLATYLNSVGPFAASLCALIAQLSRLQTDANPSPMANFLPIRFFTSRRNALDRRAEEKIRSPSKLLNVVSRRPETDTIRSIHPITALQSREIGRCVSMAARTLFRKELLCNLHQHTRILGHLSSIFCVAFDRSGRFLFTGADDNLVKVWDAQRCLLRFTFRGHSGEITDLSVSYDNTLLASGSVDKTIRVWCLRKGAALRIFRGHTGTVNSVQWVPLLAASVRYLLSAGNDCAVMFQRYNAEARAFEEPPVKFNERATGGARIISASHSPGGNLVIIGDTHQSLMMYKLSAQGVERLYEFQAHSDRIDTLVWSHHSLRFVSGSKDGTAKVWSLDEEGRWSPVELNPFPTVLYHTDHQVITEDGEFSAAAAVALPPQQANGRRAGNANSATAPNNGYKLTMLCWTLDDGMVISIGSDFLLRCWDWRRGQLLAKFPGHQNDVFCLNAHPIHKELIVSAGHDGLVIVWNVYTGKKLSKHRNENNDREAVAIFDNQISPDGTTIVCVDAMGHLSIYGVGHNQEAMKRPHEQFYTTDYKHLEIDAEGRFVDVDTGELPERLPPPPFVKADGTLLPEQDQRLVPGNDIASKEVIKPCAWLKRDIVPALSDSALNCFRSRQMEVSAAELAEFEQKHCAGSLELYAHPHKGRQRGVQKRGGVRRPPSSAAATRRFGGVHYRLAEFLRNRAPRYILDNDFPEDENDRSYSASEDGEVEENDGFMLNGIGHDERSMSSGGTSDMEDEDERETDQDGEQHNVERRTNGVRRIEEEEDENDSDYELGRVERETVFRERSSWTVTGRRKRRPPRPTSADQQQGTSSQETNNGQHAEEMYRHSARLRERAQRSAGDQPQQQQQQQSVVNSQHQQRRYKTRQTAFISSSSETEEAVIKKEEAAEEEDEENSRQSAASRTSKSRSAPLANGFAASSTAVVNGRALSSSRSGGGAAVRHPLGRRNRRTKVAGRRKGAAERRPQPRKRRRVTLPEMEDEEEEYGDDDEQKEVEQEEETEEEGAEEEAAAEEEEESSENQCDDTEYTQRPGTSKQSFERRENGRKRSAREMVSSAVPTRLPQLRQRRTVAAHRVVWADNDEEEDELDSDGCGLGARRLSMEEHDRANAHRRIHHFQLNYPQWLRMAERRRFPYFPQLGDEVVYFLQGHKSYLKELSENGVQIGKGMQPRSDLDAMEFCFVDGLEWVLRSGIHMAHLRFHDMQNVLDFLVLKQHFGASKQLNLQPGNRVEAIVDDKFYTGKVMQVTATEYDSYPNSDWCTVCVDWDNGEDDRYSPWDLQAWTKGRKSESPATKEDNAKLGEYHPKLGEWPVPEGSLANATTRAVGTAASTRSGSSLLAQEVYQQRVSELIQQLSQLKEVAPFLEPVDLHLYQDYSNYVHYPMDLTTIQERIHNNFYRRSLAILYDVQMLGKNALTYNKPKYPIVRHACALVETIFVFMEDWKQIDPLTLFRHFVEVGTESTKHWKSDLLATSVSGGGATRSSSSSSSTSALLFNTDSGYAFGGSTLHNGTAGAHHNSNTQQSAAASARLQMAPGPSSSSSSELPLWASECSAMVNELAEVFHDRVTQRHQNELSNNFLASLKSVSDAILEFQTPQAFVLRVRECLKASKEAAEESGTRRSKVFQVILNLESLLQTKEKPILAKHRLMEAETLAHERQHRRRRCSAASNSGIAANGTSRRGNGQLRRPRKAAMSACELIQNINQEEEWEEFDECGGQEQQRHRHRRQR